MRFLVFFCTTKPFGYLTRTFNEKMRERGTEETKDYELVVIGVKIIWFEIEPWNETTETKLNL